jgi:MFS family permease
VVADRAEIRRFAGRALVAGLSVAAAVAVLAVLTGSFSETDWRVIASSVGFGIASATGSAGASARLRPSGRMRLLGTGTLIASGVAFALLLTGLWIDDDSEGLWRAFGCFAVAGFGGAHACVMLGAVRGTDTEAIRRLTRASVTLGAIDTVAVILPLAAIVDDVSDALGRIFGATVVLLVLTTVLPPILRRMQPAPPDSDSVASQVLEIADRIEVLNGDPGNRAPEIRAELTRLRKLAQSFEN